MNFVLSSYEIIIALSIIIIISFIFNVIGRKWNIPSVLLLIILGIGIKYFISDDYIQTNNISSILELLGIAGLVMIVLEAALELKITKQNNTLIISSLIISFLLLIGTSFISAFVIKHLLNCEFYNALIYSVPIATISSAIVIPSVQSLDPEKKDFLIYESTFSDILGIMFFYFLAGDAFSGNALEITSTLSFNIFATIFLSLISSILLVVFFQKIKTKVRLFLLIAILFLLYALGKYFHLSSLLVILAFGMLLSNTKFLKIGFLKKYINDDLILNMQSNLHTITQETSFIARTFFFIVFGISLNLSNLLSIKVIIISTLILICIYGLRFIVLKSYFGSNSSPQSMIAPRGLITILLFYDIPSKYKINGFDNGILLFIIIFTALSMAYSIISHKKINQSKMDKFLSESN